MIHLFPRIRNRMLVLCACCIALVAAYMILNPAAGLLSILLLLVISLIVVVFTQSLIAVNTNNQILAKLYAQLDAEGFLRHYEPIRRLSVRNASLRLTVLLHTSNAYCAQGRFDEAMELLSGFPFDEIAKEEDRMLSRFSVASNLCYCAEQKSDVDAAENYMTELLALRRQLEALQESKPENKRMIFSTELNEQCLRLLKTGEADVEALRTLVKENTHQLHRITNALWVARAELAANNRREAEMLLQQIVTLAAHLYPGRAAEQILAGLPAKNDH